MATAIERSNPFDVLDTYNRKILANRSRAAIRRAMREKNVRSGDVPILVKLADLLRAAREGDQSISTSQVKASDSRSLKILMQTMQALETRLINTKAFRDRLEELAKSAQDLAENKPVEHKNLVSLEDFCKRYAELQQRIVKQPLSGSTYGVSVWPFGRQIKSI
ncbi:MAG: hypothetical protein HYX87_08950 [Chloroflexi bacterium]|nr:hypothetical protein [Chloroflexota bacterium]